MKQTLDKNSIFVMMANILLLQSLNVNLKKKLSLGLNWALHSNKRTSESAGSQLHLPV
jgi:hypothetical protein